MATVTKGRTFTSGETVTPAKLHQLVDSATVTNIVNADISSGAAIALSKLATGALPTGITVASANIVDGTIVNADINASAAIADTKLATISTAGKVANSATTATNANTANAIVTRDASGNFSAGTITANLTGTASAIADNTVTSAKIVDGSIVNADINASAAIAGTKIAPNFGSQNVVTTGTLSCRAATFITGSPDRIGTDFTSNAISTLNFGSPNSDEGNFQLQYNRAAGTFAILGGTTGSQAERMRIDASGNVGIGTSSPATKLDVNGTVTATAFSGPLTGNVTGNLTGTASAIADNTVTNAKVSASAAIADTKLATISTAGKVANSATTATSANTANAIVSRDASGNFSAGTIIGNLSGNASGSAATWATARNLVLTGDVTATFSSVNGSANVNAAATIANNAVTTSKLATATQQSLVPAGAVMPFAMNSAPSGWLAANGNAVSRSTYEALFSAIGTTHGAGNGSTTFNLPDLRGYFVRGAGTNADGTASGTFAAKQSDEFGSHTHSATTGSAGSHNHSITSYYGFGDGGGQYYYAFYSNMDGVVNGSGSRTETVPAAGNHTHTVTVTDTGGTETRPANIALLYCIKF